MAINYLEWLINQGLDVLIKHISAAKYRSLEAIDQLRDALWTTPKRILTDHVSASPAPLGRIFDTIFWTMNANSPGRLQLCLSWCLLCTLGRESDFWGSLETLLPAKRLNNVPNSWFSWLHRAPEEVRSAIASYEQLRRWQSLLKAHLVHRRFYNQSSFGKGKGMEAEACLKSKNPRCWLAVRKWHSLNAHCHPFLKNILRMSGG